MIDVRDLRKSLPTGTRTVDILRGITFSVPRGQFAAIMGSSGSGKSTLLGLLAGLDTPTSGDVHLNGIPISYLPEDKLAQVRGRTVGFVFQSYQLIPTLTALENVLLPYELNEVPKAPNHTRANPDSSPNTTHTSSPTRTSSPTHTSSRNPTRTHGLDRARELLTSVGLADRTDHYPVQLSGGEQQRVALARAFILRPPIVLADEPTGNLDTTNGRAVLDLLLNLNQKEGTTLVLVTHDTTLANLAHRRITLRDGVILSDEMNGNATIV